MAIVERIDDRGVRGWVAHDEASGDEVSVKVNDFEVATTSACLPVPFNGETRNFGFARDLSGLWPYLDRSDEVSFEHNGQRLAIVGHGFVYRTERVEREKDLQELLMRVSQGWIFDEHGELAEPRQTTGSYERSVEALIALVQQEMGLTLFPIYGTLLGCVREGDFIAHDHDLDFAYLSEHDTPEGVKAEFLELCELLIDRDYSGSISEHAFAIEKPLAVDIYPAWVHEGKFDVSFGYHGEAADWTPAMAEFDERKLGSMTLAVPRGAERILAQIYGPDWRTPDPEFSHRSPSRKQDRAFLPSEQQLLPVFWKQYYKTSERAEGSTFAAFVAERVSPNAVVIDVGCGAGRDTVYFASHGHTAIGADASAEGIELAKAKAPPGCRFEVVDVSDAAQLDALFAAPEVAEARAGGRELVAYLRFFLHAIPRETEETLLEGIARNLPEVTLAAEFRTERDAEIPKFNAPHYRRFVDSAALAAELEERWGFSVVHFSEGTGLSVFKGEDPFLCRILARRATGSTALPHR